jgi:hypothetical protein
VNLGILGALGGLFFALSTFVVTLLSMRARRKDKEAIDAREASELGIVMLQWSGRVRRLAATNGWDQDPAWPTLPEEATPEYLRGKASNSGNDELVRLVEIAQKLAKGDPK